MWERADMNRPRTIRMATLGVVPRLVPAKTRPPAPTPGDVCEHAARGGSMHRSLPDRVRHVSRLAIAVVVALAGPSAAAQSLHEAPSAAPSTGRVAPRDEPGQPLHVSGLVVRRRRNADRRASLYVYQTDHEGYYGVKPVSDNRNPASQGLPRGRYYRGMGVRYGQTRFVPGQPACRRTSTSRCRRQATRRRCSRSSSRAIRSSRRDADESRVLGRTD